MIAKKDILEILKIGLILFAITAISAGILAAVNGLTAPVIAANSEKKRNAAMTKVMPGVESFEKLDYEPGGSVTAIFSGGQDKYVALCEPKGYGGAISMVVGVNADGTVSGIDITTQSETPGLGANCIKDEFKNQFIGKTEDIKVVKRGATDNQIDAISSATVTSKAVTAGVNDALAVIAELKNGGMGDEK